MFRWTMSLDRVSMAFSCGLLIPGLRQEDLFGQSWYGILFSSIRLSQIPAPLSRQFAECTGIMAIELIRRAFYGEFFQFFHAQIHLTGQSSTAAMGTSQDSCLVRLARLDTFSPLGSTRASNSLRTRVVVDTGEGVGGKNKAERILILILLIFKL